MPFFLIVYRANLNYIVHEPRVNPYFFGLCPRQTAGPLGRQGVPVRPRGRAAGQGRVGAERRLRRWNACRAWPGSGRGRRTRCSNGENTTEQTERSGSCFCSSCPACCACPAGPACCARFLLGLLALRALLALALLAISA